jgi:molybdopterin synthase catalytic subunit
MCCRMGMRFPYSRLSRGDDFSAMNRQLTISEAPIHERELLAQRPFSRTAGAVVCFLGIVRENEAGEWIRALEYETFEKMARHQFKLLFDQLEGRWPMVESVRLVHRIGMIGSGEPSLWVEVAAPHRGEAFAACEWLITEMKKTVPIWKKPVL